MSWDVRLPTPSLELAVYTLFVPGEVTRNTEH
ncbi:unnamed protein product [Aphis gossypii]|uniref:Uncharacterized protein n=1 Tax=Aphis gossypii TaxID=80765 RepID=A0A9P0IQ49_APHGO|nr:unnamed protein product [Aphis gossypii]